MQGINNAKFKQSLHNMNWTEETAVAVHVAGINYPEHLKNTSKGYID